MNQYNYEEVIKNLQKEIEDAKSLIWNKTALGSSYLLKSEAQRWRKDGLIEEIEVRGSDGGFRPPRAGFNNISITKMLEDVLFIANYVHGEWDKERDKSRRSFADFNRQKAELEKEIKEKDEEIEELDTLLDEWIAEAKYWKRDAKTHLAAIEVSERWNKEKERFLRNQIEQRKKYSDFLNNRLERKEESLEQEKIKVQNSGQQLVLFKSEAEARLNEIKSDLQKKVNENIALQNQLNLVQQSKITAQNSYFIEINNKEKEVNILKTQLTGAQNEINNLLKQIKKITRERDSRPDTSQVVYDKLVADLKVAQTTRDELSEKMLGEKDTHDKAYAKLQKDLREQITILTTERDKFKQEIKDGENQIRQLEKKIAKKKQKSKQNKRQLTDKENNLSAIKTKIEEQVRKAGNSRLIAAIDNLQNYSELVDIQQKFANEIEQKKQTAEKFNIAFGIIAGVSVAGLLGIILRTKNNKKEIIYKK
jgi:chromosome segregation ATPase